MKEAYQQFGNRFAAAVVAKDYVTAHSLLAAWLQPKVTVAKLQEMIEKEISEVCAAAELDELVYPETWSLDGNSSTVEELKEPHSYISTRNSGWLGAERPNYSSAGDLLKPLADEVTADNFRQWMCIQFMPTEEAQNDLDIDAFLDFWMAVVEVDGQLQIGYFELEDPD
ncbi:MAG: hypothetical protein HY231_01190 [Acidobacteria bacterium]|nr:hypothetical protein [Acidobacteriota bacterium]